jgi:Tetratricopeptide repeat
VTRPTSWIAAAACAALALTALGAAPPNLFRALEAQRQRAAERPDDPGVYNDLGNLLALAGDAANAEAAYRRAVELAPDRAAPRYNLALLLQQRGDRREALKQYRTVVELDPAHAWAHYQIGSLYEAAGDEEKAIRAYARAFSLEPRLAFAEFNPGIIENKLVAKAMLRGYRGVAGEPQAPKAYEDPSRIAGLLLPPIPTAAASEEATPQTQQPDLPAGSPEAAPTVLSGDDLDARGGVNQASPQGTPTFRPPAVGLPASRPQVRTWSETQGGAAGRSPSAGAPSVGIAPGYIPVQPATPQSPPGAGQPRVVRPPGRVRYQPGVESTGRLDLEVIPGPAPERAG